MKITWRPGAYVLGVCATAAALAGCGGGANAPAGFTPSTGSASNGAQSIVAVKPAAGLTHYYLVDLGTLGGTSSVANSIDNRGLIAGLSKVNAGTAFHAVLWVAGRKIDLGTLGGPSSAVGWPVKNNRGEIAGFSDLAQTDPLGENFCGTGSPNLCAGFIWKNQTLTPLAPLGGNNSFAAGVNRAGRVVGFAETGVHDSSCGAPQVMDYDATIWRPDGQPRALQPLAGDTVSQAVSINDDGAAVGASGPCGPPNNVGYGTAHAVVWRRAAAPVDLGSLGGTTANIATAINNRGEIVGQSALAGNPTYHAVRWEHGAIADLGVLPGDFVSEALGLNEKQQTVGYSCDTGGSCRGFIFQNGAMTDLNLLVSGTQLYITGAGDINDSGWIVGQALDMKTGRAPAILLIPANGARASAAPAYADKVTLPEAARRQLLLHRGFRLFIQ